MEGSLPPLLEEGILGKLPKSNVALSEKLQCQSPRSATCHHEMMRASTTGSPYDSDRICTQERLVIITARGTVDRSAKRASCKLPEKGNLEENTRLLYSLVMDG